MQKNHRNQPIEEILLYVGVLEVSPGNIKFVPAPIHPELQIMMLHRTMAGFGTGTFTWNMNTSTSAPDAEKMFQHLSGIVKRTVPQSIRQIMVLCKYDYLPAQEQYSSDIDWIIVDAKDQWLYPSGDAIDNITQNELKKYIRAVKRSFLLKDVRREKLFPAN